MTVVTEVLARWAAEEPRYELYAIAMRTEIPNALRVARVAYDRTSVRVKDSASLATKVIRKKYSRYEQVTDKLGARVVVRVPSDVDRAVAALHAEFGGTIEDKRLAPDVDRFAYRSVHLQVQGCRNTADFADLECEIQVRTVSEDAWATMEHFLNYKAVSETPYPHRRSLSALAAVLELADLRYEQLFQEMIGSPDYFAMSVLAEIEASFLTLGGEWFDRALSGAVIEAILPAYAGIANDAKAIGTRIESWVQQNKDWFPERLDRLRADRTSSVFVSQPELLLLLNLLSSGSSALAPLWSKMFDLGDLEDLASDFGYSIPGY